MDDISMEAGLTVYHKYIWQIEISNLDQLFEKVVQHYLSSRIIS